jgi:hypothetical protein
MQTHARTFAAALVAAVAIQAVSLAQVRSSSTWTPPRTSWGHPDLSGTYTNKDEANTPLERPDQLKGKNAEEFSAADLDKLTQERQAVAAKIAGRG